MFDSHIHLDQYDDLVLDKMLEDIDGVIAVSMGMKSFERLLNIKQRYNKVHIACGFHPEQVIDMNEVNALLSQIDKHHDELIAIGEVGLPQYLMREDDSIDQQSYIDVLELFIQKAAQYDLPVVLHAVYDDTLIVLDLLKQYNIKRAHFHWFKGSDAVLDAVLSTEYMVSVTPDVTWNDKTRRVIERFPLERLMIETDGPWPHEGFVQGEIDQQLFGIIDVIDDIKGVSTSDVIHQVNENTKNFYRLE